MKIYSAMASVMRDVEAIGKDQKNAQQGFKYRGIDDVYNALHGILAKHGIFTTPEVLEKTRQERENKNGTILAFTCIRMKYTFYAEDGTNVSCVVEGEGMDSGDKSSNKAMAIAHKYALLQTFCIPTAEDKDPDSQVHEVAPRSLKDRQKPVQVAAQTSGESVTVEQVEKELRASTDNLNLSAIYAKHKTFVAGLFDEQKAQLRKVYEEVQAQHKKI